MPRDLFSPLAATETFSQRDFWRRFERIIVRELSAVHAQGVRGIRRADEGYNDHALEQLGGNVNAPVLADRLREIARRTQARWVACVAETRIHLVHGPDIELESELVDGTWYHSWRHRVERP